MIFINCESLPRSWIVSKDHLQIGISSSILNLALENTKGVCRYICKSGRIFGSSNKRYKDVDEWRFLNFSAVIMFQLNKYDEISRDWQR